MSNGGGLDQDGSLRAQNTENEANNAALELFVTILAANFPGASQQQETIARIRP